MRWGATSAPSASVKSNLEADVGRWMNRWFTALGTYGCFPYPDGVTVKVTGWAVRPGNESWVSDLDSSIAVYTETDGEGEPMLYIDPDECIDCGACEPECPVEAIFVEDELPEEWGHFTEINARYFELRESPAEWHEYKDEHAADFEKPS